MYIYIHTYTHTYIYTCINIYTDTYTYLHIHNTYIYIYTHIHTCINIHIEAILTWTYTCKYRKTPLKSDPDKSFICTQTMPWLLPGYYQWYCLTIITITLLLTSDKGHYEQQQGYESGLEILLLDFCSLNPYWNWIETQCVSQFVWQLFLNLRNTLHAAWIAQFGLKIRTYTYLYIPVGEASILICCHVKHHFDILKSGWVLKKSYWSFAVVKY